MRSRSPVRYLVAGIAAALACLGAGAQVRPDPPVRISVPAQPLASAIGQLAEQTDLSVYAPSDLVADKMSAPVDGVLSAREALDAMLRGTGLEVTVSSNGTYIVKARTRPPPDAPAAPAPSRKRRPPPPAVPLADGPLVQDALIVVGSYSKGLSQSLNLKLHADTISDAIVAADIGKLPAVNVAEALQRLPGVTISREAGEGQFVGVRGLGPNFQSVTFNGVPIAVNENIRNSDQSGRQFRFRVLPADLIGGVVVTKSPTADLIDGGIGANIDIVTVKPLDKGNFASRRLFASYDERASHVTPNGSVSAGWTNAAETFGLIASVSYQRRDVQFDRFQTFGYDTLDIDGQEDIQVADGWTTTVEEEKRRRLSYLASLQWRPRDNLEIHSDFLYSNFNNRIAENRITYGIGAFVEDHLVPGSARIRDGVLYAGTFDGGRIYRNAEYSEQTHRNQSFSIGADWEAGSWTVSPTFSFSEAESDLDVPLQRIESQTTETEGFVYRFDLGDDPVRDGHIDELATDLDLTAPDTVPFRRYRIRPINSEDQDTTFLLDVGRDFNREVAGLLVTDLKFGAQYTDRFRDYQRRDRMLTLRDGYTVDSSYFGYPVPGDAMDRLIGVRSLWTGPRPGRFEDAFEVAGEFPGTKPQPEDLVPTNDDLRQSYRIEESVVALYGRADFETHIYGLPTSGNIGLRWVDTGTTVYGTSVTAEPDERDGVTIASAPRVTRNSYAMLLPSLNVSIDLTGDIILRLAASRSMTRPSLASLRDATVPSSATVSEIYERGKAALANEDLDINAVGGNPDLTPYTSTNLDISLEKYMDEFGVISASLFRKEIGDFISGAPRTEVMPFAVRDGSTVLLEILVNRPQNIGDASLSGLELGYVNRFGGGFGLSASASLTSSAIDLALQNGHRQSARLQGVSDFSYSVTPFFERGPVETYLSYTWRSEFDANGNVTIASDARTDAAEAIVAASFGTLDFGFAYHLSRNFDLFAEGVNLTDSHQAAYQGFEARPYQLQQYGRTLNIGIRADF